MLVREKPLGSKRFFLFFKCPIRGPDAWVRKKIAGHASRTREWPVSRGS